MHENCGVVAVIDLAEKQDVVPLAVAMAQELQHRGELGAGLSWRDADGQLRILKDHGLVSQALSPEKLLAANAKGSAAIAHTRYATNAHLQRCMVQPYGYDAYGDNMDDLPPEPDGRVRRLPQGFAFAFNGNIANHEAMQRRLEEMGEPVRLPGDTEVIGRTIIASWSKGTQERMRKILRPLDTLDGSFNMVMLQQDGTVNAVRDPHGFHPLTYARNGSLLAIASEDIAIRAVWPNAEIHDVEPGYLLQALPKRSEVAEQQLWLAEKSHCFFEWKYFADRRSRLDGTSVANARYEAGKILAEMDRDRPRGDIVVPVPESAKIAANGYADTRRLPRVDGILKNEGIGRTFTDAGDRLRKAQLKYTVDPNFLRGRNIILIDDSLVRGNTMQALVQQLRGVGGVAEINLRLAAPPIMAPCFYGIDFQTLKELFVRRFPDAELTVNGVLSDEVLAAMAPKLGVDSIKYLPVDGVPRAVAKEKESLCMACVTKEYPTREGARLYMLEEERCRCGKNG
jgi:amidophosphoribosyltransferase